VRYPSDVLRSGLDPNGSHHPITRNRRIRSMSRVWRAGAEHRQHLPLRTLLFQLLRVL